MNFPLDLSSIAQILNTLVSLSFTFRSLDLFFIEKGFSSRKFSTKHQKFESLSTRKDPSPIDEISVTVPLENASALSLDFQTPQTFNYTLLKARNSLTTAETRLGPTKDLHRRFPWTQPLRAHRATKYPDVLLRVLKTCLEDSVLQIRVIAVVIFFTSIFCLFHSSFYTMIILVLMHFVLRLLTRNPYFGGSDSMIFLTAATTAVTLSAAPDVWKTSALYYLAIQLLLSYFLAGWAKAKNPDWWKGKALTNFLLPHNSNKTVQLLASHPKRIQKISWMIIILELVFPIFIFVSVAFFNTNPALVLGLMGVGLLFHLGVFYVFSLNHFFWTWLAAYPSLFIFLQR